VDCTLQMKAKWNPKLSKQKIAQQKKLNAHCKWKQNHHCKQKLTARRKSKGNKLCARISTRKPETYVVSSNSSAFSLRWQPRWRLIMYETKFVQQSVRRFSKCLVLLLHQDGTRDKWRCQSFYKSSELGFPWSLVVVRTYSIVRRVLWKAW